VTVASALRDVTNALLDLQQADHDTFQHPMQRLDQALSGEDLKPFTDNLTAGLDLDAFVELAEQGGGMGARASLNWPPEREKQLGYVVLMIRKTAEHPDWLINFGFNFYQASSPQIVATIRKITTSVFVPFGRDYKTYVEGEAAKMPVPVSRSSDLHRVFIVHGHDEAPRETVARFITTAGLEPVILHEQASLGMTIPEKLIANSNVGFAVVLLTPDDFGRSKAETELNPRARQNVILELGYFVGHLGRDRVCALLKDTVEIPSDYMGVVYTPFDAGGGWKQALAKELQAAGYVVDWNKIMR